MSPAVAIILNGISRNKRRFYKEIYPALAQTLNPEVFETKWAGHASELSHQAVEKGFSTIIAAGGDGTLNQVVNGAMRSRVQTFALGLIPLGTGNDFAKMCGLSVDPKSLINLIQINRPKSIDIGKIVCQDADGREVIRYFVNACSMGMGPAVVKRLEKSNRALGPTLTYWNAITRTFLSHRPQEIACKTHLWQWRGKIRVLVIANGRSFGNSLHIAPDAVLNDGIFNTFIAGEVPLLKFLIYQQILKGKKKIEDNYLITYNTLTHAELSSPSSCTIECEGELAGYLPARIEVIPSAIRFLY